MDRRHGPLRNHHSFLDNWPSLGPSMTGRRTSPWHAARCAQVQGLALLPQASQSQFGGVTSSTSSLRNKQRRGQQPRHCGHRSAGSNGYPYHNGDGASSNDFMTFHFRQFSEDSGVSSCGSSASSVADEFETPGHALSVSKTPAWLDRPARWSSSPVCGAQSRTVASVLAAGVSDSEETDHCESDDDSDNIFMDRMKYNRFYTSLRKIRSSWPNVCAMASKSNQHSKKQLKHSDKEKQLDHCGRDILDLGLNLVTQFPLRATELPEKNLSLFLQNRSQYHRLGKFGTVEKLHFADCKKQCGFSFPIPPGENVEGH